MRIVLSILAMLTCGLIQAQQIAHANSVQLVSTPGTRIVSQGSIKFTGTTSWKDSGTTTMLPNPAANISHWIDSTSTGVLTASSQGTTVFNNYLINQQIVGPTTFHNLRIAGAGVTLYQTNQVKNILALDSGLVYFNNPTDSIFVTNNALAAITSTSNHTKSWIHGKLARTLTITSPAEYLFPIGKIKLSDSLYAPIKLEKTTGTPVTYSAVYFPNTPFDHLNFLNPPIDHLSEREYWEVLSNVASGPDDDARLSLSWRGYSLVSANPLVRDSLLVAQYVFNPAGRWEATGGGYAAIVTGADSLFGYVKHNNGSNNFNYAERRFTLATFSKFNALPLKIIYWTATADGDRVRLNWNVQNEQDIRKYDIEKSTDGIRFTHLASVNSMQQAAWLYTEFDNNPAIGWNYYRLKITDRQLNIKYTDVRKVRFDKGLESISVFPNPTTVYLNVILPSSRAPFVQMQLFSIDGKLLANVKPTGTNTSIDVQKLAAGTYVLRLLENGSVLQSYQFVKQ